MAITNIARGMVLICDIVNASEDLAKAFRDGSESLKIAKAVNSLAMLGFSAAEITMLTKKSSTQNMLLLKRFDYLTRSCNLALKFQEESSQLECTFQGTLKFITKISGSVFDMIRTFNETSYYEEKKYLEEFTKNPNAQRPTYEHSRDGSDIIGYRTIDPEECQINMKISRKFAEFATYSRVVSEAKVLERVGTSCQGITEKLIEYYELRTALREGRELEILIDGRIDLNRLNAIPLILHDDPVFRENICPINQTPIRDPVRDPNGITVYERSAIYNWLNLRQ